MRSFYPYRRSINQKKRSGALVIGVKLTAVSFGVLCLLIALSVGNRLPTAKADILRHIPFGARLTNSSGAIVADGNYSITFRIYTVETGGTAVWTETHTVAVADGIVAINLGSVTAFPASLTFNDSSYYLGVQVGSDAEMSPRKRIGAVPMAFNSDTIDGFHASQSPGTDTIPVTDGSGNLVLQGGATFAGLVNSQSIIPTTGNLYDLGSAARPFANGYINNLTVGSINTSGTTSNSFTVNTDAADDEDSSLLFYRGGVLTNAQILWNSTTDLFNFNNGIAVTGGGSYSETLTVSQTGANALSLTGAPAASATSSLFQLGSAISGGSASGTFIGLNAASGYTGNLLDLQVDGTSQFRVEADGDARLFKSGASNPSLTVQGARTATYGVDDISLGGQGGLTKTRHVLTSDILQLGRSAAASIYINEGAAGVNQHIRIVPASGHGVYIAQGVPTSANLGLLSIGPSTTAFDGSTAGFFAGSASGTQLAINAASGFAGNLLDMQVAGDSKLLVDASGNLSLDGTEVCTSTGCTPTAGSGNYIQNTASEQASANFNIDGTGTIAGNFIVDTSTLFADAAAGEVGIGTASPDALLHVNDGAILGAGTFGGAGSTPASGAGTRFMWIPNKGAIRAGRVGDSKWDDANVGEYSTALGFESRASGNFASVAIGYTNSATGAAATALGSLSTASGSNSIALGEGVTASNTAAIAIGKESTASGVDAITLGKWLTSGTAANTITIGRGVDNANRLVNNSADSLYVGFNSTVPTLVVTAGTGAGTFGKVGIGTGTSTPTAKLHVTQSGEADYAAKIIDTSTGADSNGLFIETRNNDSGDAALQVITNDTFDTFIIRNNGMVGVGEVNPDARLEIGGNVGSTAWGTSGLFIQAAASTLTDTGTTGTRTTAVASSFAQPTFAASNAVTVTDAANLYIAGPPIQGTNMTLTSAWSLWVDSGSVRFDGPTVYQPSGLQTVVAASAVTADASKIRVGGSGSAITLTSTPTIADGKDGQMLIIQGTDNTNTVTFQDQGSLTNSNLELGAANRALGAGDILTLTFDSNTSVWYEVSFTNN